MADLVMILGESGTGKSTSMRNLKPKECALINVVGKPLPFKGGKSFPQRVSDSAEAIRGGLKALAEDKTKRIIIIDDFQYIMSNEYMKSILDKLERDGEFRKYKSIGYNAWSIIDEARKMRDDQIVFFLAHNDTDNTGKSKCKTVGRLLDDKITIEGLFSIVLNTVIHPEKPIAERFWFATQNNGFNTTKSPMGMFSDLEIPNDLQIVVDSITNYYKGE